MALENRLAARETMELTTPTPTATALFVGHAAADRDLVDSLVDLFSQGMGISPDTIFYSSLPGLSVIPGQEFPYAIDEQLRRALLYLPVITHAFLASQYALAELGMARAWTKPSVPLLAIPIEEAQTPLLLLQHAHGVNIRDAQQLDQLADELPPRCGVPAPPRTRWNRAREAFSQKVTEETGRQPSRAQRAEEPVAPRVFATSDSEAFRSYAESLVLAAKKVVMMGSGINLLHRDPFQVACIDRADAGELDLEIYLADPSSPPIQLRLMEEELGSSKPPVGGRGLRNRLEALVQTRRQMRNPDRFRLRLFRNYPTFATLRIDNRYFMYPYAYALVGNFSPVLEFDADIPAHEAMVGFLNGQLERVRSASVPGEWALLEGSSVRVPSSAVAVFVVPPATSAIYRVGSRLLGYDVRREVAVESPIEGVVGAAGSFGFHLTVADALYYDDVDRVWAMAEVEALAKEFAPFFLTNIELRTGFPDPSSLALVVSDPLRSLEALHCELVFRIYRRARSSDYTLGDTPITRASAERSDLMLSRYRAPYILKEFQPHFTIASSIPAAQEERVTAVVEQEVESLLTSDLHVKSLVVATKTDAGTWRIERELGLGGR
jgi:Protein of unknown function (DUF1045)